MNANEQLLYALQEKTVLSQQQELPSMLGQPDCADAWRQRRMYELIQPIVAYGIEGRWLTIGAAGRMRPCSPNPASRQAGSSRHRSARHRSSGSRTAAIFRARTFLMSWGKCVVVLAKSPLADPLRERLDAAGFKRHPLPKNPYLAPGAGAVAPLPQ